MPVKRCPKCGKGCGPRLAVCECGFPFQPKAKAEAKAEVVPAPEVLVERVIHHSSDLARIYTPGTGMDGKFKVKLIPVAPPDEPDKSNVRTWVERLQDDAVRDRKFYTWPAIRYMARNSYKGDDKKRRLLLNVLEEVRDEVEEIAL